MDSESCELGSSGKRNWSDSYCCSLPPAKRFCKNATFSSEEKEEDDFSCISDLIQVTGDCDFSDGNLRFYDESTPNSTQTDLDDLLTSLLTESEIPNSFSVPETINGLDGDPGKMGGSTSLYSGPTLTDIQSALSMYHKKEQSLPTSSIFDSSTIFDSLQSAKPPPSQNLLDSVSYGSYPSFSSSINDIFYRRLRRTKSEAKYSLKVKCPGKSIGDGYKWRKYGQKSIKNSPYPRSYYRCTNPKCRAKKQVERCVDDPETVTITYQGLHLHFSHPSLQITQQRNYSLSQQDNNIYEEGRNKKAAVLDNGYNGCFNNEGGDLMQSSESPTIVAAHQEAKDNCCESLESRRNVPVAVIEDLADLLDGYNGCFKNEGGDLMQSSESSTIVAAHQEAKDNCSESLGSRRNVQIAVIADLLDGYNGCSNNGGGDLMQSSESPTIVAAHQEAKDNCCESLRSRRNVPVAIKADLLDGYNGCFNNEGGDLMQSFESHTIVAVHREEKFKCCESLRSRESIPVTVVANFAQPQILNGTSEENSDIIDENGMNFRAVEEKGGGWCRDGLLQDIVPFQVINPRYSLSSPASSSSSSP